NNAVVSQGDIGQEVRDLQSQLQNLGYDLEIDGSYGPITQQRVIDFQIDQGWSGDGEVGHPTLNALNQSSNSQSDNVTNNNTEESNDVVENDGSNESEVSPPSAPE